MSEQQFESQVEFRGITKTFPGGVTANDDVTLSIREGEIHGLLGENGAGKTTLMKILYGLYESDGGEIRIRGEPVSIDSPADAITQGIGMVHQHFMLIPRFSVIENVILGEREASSRFSNILPQSIRRLFTLDEADSRKRVAQLCEEFGIDLELDTSVWELDVGQQQRVEIIKALYRDVDLLVLDEPTAVLTPEEVEELFRTLQQLVAQGLTVILITHKLEEVMAITDRITVLRNGSVIDTVATESVTRSELARMMVGQEVIFDVDKKSTVESDDRVLSARGLTAIDDRDIQSLQSVDLDIDVGEVLGIAGVSGNGQNELAECLVGLRSPTGGSITVNGTDLAGANTRAFIDAGVSYIPADRLEYGCAPGQSVKQNMVMKDLEVFSNGVRFDEDAAREHALELIEEFDIRVPDPDTPAGKLSGGNIQKMILARELWRDPNVLVANQPTRGVDVGAIETIRNVLIDQCASGTGMVLISEELDEVMQMSDRIVVMYDGEIVHETPASEADRDRISRYMTEGEYGETAHSSAIQRGESA